jgi:sn-glycerol 3-phosphate transport system substrate-binding protein
MQPIRGGVRLRFLALGAAIAVALAACGGSSSSNKGSGAPGGGSSNLPSCPVHALDNVTTPVTITVWHSMTRALLDTLTTLTKQYNASQHKVIVKLVNQTSYTDTLTQFQAGLATHNLPDVMQGEDVALQKMIDTQAVLPAQACVNADNYPTTDFVQRTLKYYTVGGVLYPMPFNVSNPVLYYDKSAFKAAGLDPNKPPTTLDEVRADAQAIVNKHVEPYGIAFHIDSWFLEHWLALGNQTFVDNDNGRTKRATSVTFGGSAGLDIFNWLAQMQKDHLLLSTGSNPSSIDHYLAVANKHAAMTIDTTAALGTISQVLGSGQFSDVDLGVGPMPSPSGTGGGGVLVGGGAMYIVKQSSPEKQAAAWDYLKFLDSPQSQATWAAGTGYVPIRKSATTLEPLVTWWTTHPYYKVAYDQLVMGPETPATAGPVIGDYGSKGVGVRGAVIDAMDSMLTDHTPPATALQNAVKNANQAIETYNQRIGD